MPAVRPEAGNASCGCWEAASWRARVPSSQGSHEGRFGLSPSSHDQAIARSRNNPLHSPADAWPCCGSTHQHTAHQLGLVRFAYRFHPFFGQEVRVIRRLRAGVDTMVIVQGEPDLRIVAPCWMLDEGGCSAMVVEGCGRIAAEALVALRSLVDAQGLLAGSGQAECDSLMANGDSHELPRKDRTKDRSSEVGSPTRGTGSDRGGPLAAASR